LIQESVKQWFQKAKVVLKPAETIFGKLKSRKPSKKNELNLVF
jgi:hypothetical protein